MNLLSMGSPSAASIGDDDGSVGGSLMFGADPSVQPAPAPAPVQREPEPAPAPAPAPALAPAPTPASTPATPGAPAPSPSPYGLRWTGPNGRSGSVRTAADTAAAAAAAAAAPAAATTATAATAAVRSGLRADERTDDGTVRTDEQRSAETFHAAGSGRIRRWHGIWRADGWLMGHAGRRCQRLGCQ